MNISLTTWIFADPLSNDTMMLQPLDTLVNLPPLWQSLLITGGLACAPLFNNTWQGAAPVNNLKSINVQPNPLCFPFLPPPPDPLPNVVWISSPISPKSTDLMLFYPWWTMALLRGQFSFPVQNLLILNKPHNYWWIDSSLDLNFPTLSFQIEAQNLHLEPQKNTYDF